MAKPGRLAIKVAAAGLLLLIGLATAIMLTAPRPGPVDFATLAPGPGSTLICPADLCLAASEALPAPVFTISAERLAAKLRRHASGEVGVEEWPGEDPLRLRFVHRSLLLRLPEVIDAQIVARSSGAASLALYARPAIPALDFGAARARMERWIEALSR